jgi:hypothetical protein
VHWLVCAVVMDVGEQEALTEVTVGDEVLSPPPQPESAITVPTNAISIRLPSLILHLFHCIKH